MTTPAPSKSERGGMTTEEKGKQKTKTETKHAATEEKQRYEPVNRGCRQLDPGVPAPKQFRDMPRS